MMIRPHGTDPSTRSYPHTRTHAHTQWWSITWTLWVCHTTVTHEAINREEGPRGCWRKCSNHSGPTLIFHCPNQGPLNQSCCLPFFLSFFQIGKSSSHLEFFVSPAHLHHYNVGRKILRIVTRLFVWKLTIIQECSECRACFRFFAACRVTLWFPASGFAESKTKIVTCFDIIRTIWNKPSIPSILQLYWTFIQTIASLYK